MYLCGEKKFTLEDVWRRATEICNREKLYLQRDSKRNLLSNLEKAKFRMGMFASCRYIRCTNSSEEISYLTQRTALANECRMVN